MRGLAVPVENSRSLPDTVVLLAIWLRAPASRRPGSRRHPSTKHRLAGLRTQMTVARPKRESRHERGRCAWFQDCLQHERMAPSPRPNATRGAARAGKDARVSVPLDWHVELVTDGRADPVTLSEGQAATPVAKLVPTSVRGGARLLPVPAARRQGVCGCGGDGARRVGVLRADLWAQPGPSSRLVR
jgi:hypothetical protein